MFDQQRLQFKLSDFNENTQLRVTHLNVLILALNPRYNTLLKHVELEGYAGEDDWLMFHRLRLVSDICDHLYHRAMFVTF